MAKGRTPLPYAKFSYEDFFNDPAVVRMSNEEIGAYLRLLRAAWASDAPGLIPCDQAYLSSMSGMGTLWAAHEEAIGQAFDRTSNPGSWTQKRIVREYDVARKQVVYGVEGAQVRWAAHRPPNGLPIGSKSKSKRKSKRKEEPNTLFDAGAPNGSWASRFDEWWTLYGKKVGRSTCEALWAKLTPKGDALFAEVMDGTKRYLGWERVKRGFKLDPERFLKRRIWQDEGEPATEDEWAKFLKGGSRP